MNLPFRLLAGALFGILYAVIIAMGYLTSNGNTFAIIISAFFGAIMMYVFHKFLTEKPDPLEETIYGEDDSESKD